MKTIEMKFHLNKGFVAWGAPYNCGVGSFGGSDTEEKTWESSGFEFNMRFDASISRENGLKNTLYEPMKRNNVFKNDFRALIKVNHGFKNGSHELMKQNNQSKIRFH